MTVKGSSKRDAAGGQDTSTLLVPAFRDTLGRAIE